MVWTKPSVLLMVAMVGSYGSAWVRPSVRPELADPSIIVGQAAQAGSRCLRSVSYQVTFPCLMAASASGVSRSAATTAWAGWLVNRVRYRALRRARRVSSSPPVNDASTAM